MENRTYESDELCQMSYQELRKISILLRLPANIKKKHMISMIEAHQKGDGRTKTEIANKIMEERNLRRMNTQVKRGKPFILSSRVRTHQVSTDLSVATKHEFETCYSYVAHYTKRNKETGMIKEESEVPRRNRSVVQAPAKSARKMTAVGKTETSLTATSFLESLNLLHPEIHHSGGPGWALNKCKDFQNGTRGKQTLAIMLPRNHSLTTLVQLMPQHERNFIPSCKATRVLTSETNWSSGANFETASTSPSATDHHCQGVSPFVYGNIPFHPDYGNSFISSTSHELYRSLPYWHPRELYNSVIPGNLIIPVLPNMINPEVPASHAPSPATINLSADAGFSQRQCENFVRCNGNDKAVFDSENNVGLVNVYTPEDVNTYSGNPTKAVVNSEMAEPNYDCNRRFDSLRHGDSQQNENLTYLVDIFAPRGGAQTSEQIYTRSVSTIKNPDFGNQIIYPLIKRRSTEEIGESARENECHVDEGVRDESYHESEYEEGETVPEETGHREGDDYVPSNAENSLPGGKTESESRGGGNEESPHGWRYRLPSGHQDRTVLPSFVSTFHEMRSPERFVSEICLDSSRVSPSEADATEENEHENSISVTMSNFSHCRYISGHNHFPESVCKSFCTSDTTPLFASNSEKTGQNCAYSLCKNISTETTAVHSQPIMTIPASSGRSEDERTWNGCEMKSNQSVQEVMSNNNVGNLFHHQRPMFYSYPEEHSPYAVDAGSYPTWYECSEGLEAKITQNNRHDVRFVQCKKHGYHYFYALSSSQ